MNLVIFISNGKPYNERYANRFIYLIIAIELDLSLSGSYGGKSCRKPMTVKGYESMSPEF